MTEQERSELVGRMLPEGISGQGLPAGPVMKQRPANVERCGQLVHFLTIDCTYEGDAYCYKDREHEGCHAIKIPPVEVPEDEEDDISGHEWDGTEPEDFAR